MKEFSYFLDNDLPISDYYKQFEVPEHIEVGKVYLLNAGIYWQHYKILAIIDGVAIGKEIANGNNNYNIGGKDFFYVGGNLHGWRYKDNRSVYRLRKEVN